MAGQGQAGADAWPHHAGAQDRHTNSCLRHAHEMLRHHPGLDGSGRHRAVLEGWTLSAAMTEATRRTRIGLPVTALTYRHPALLAKQTVTVDHLSGGRLEFGIGSGWSAVELQLFASVGRDHPEARLTESLDLMRLLWAQQQSNSEGQYYLLRDAVGNPRPIQQPAPPIWIGAAGPATLRLATRMYGTRPLTV